MQQREDLTIATEDGKEFDITVEVFEDDDGNEIYSYHHYHKPLFNSASGDTYFQIREALRYIEDFYAAFEDSGFEIEEWSGDGWYTFVKEVDE